MANKVLKIGRQAAADALEKYVDIDMDSVYKKYSHAADVNAAMFAKEQAKNRDGQIFKEDSSAAIAVDKQFEKSLDIDYSGYKLSRNVNVKAVQQAIHNIFTWLPGERILNPGFGSNLKKYLYEGITSATEELINAEIRKCIMEWEPRANVVQINNVSDDADTEDNTMHLQILYTIPSLSDRQYAYDYYYSSRMS